MTKEQAIAGIEKEFAVAQRAEKNRNDGMVRVCARRAAGLAITFWLQSHQHNWGVDAMTQLRSLQQEDTLPEEVRNAAARLTTKVTQQFDSPFTENPIEDSKRIIDFLLRN